MTSPLRRGPELWAGAECTVNRVGNAYLDQLELTGHAARLDDLDRFAAVGISAFRFPLLWERTAPLGVETADWTWADERIARLSELGIRPIAGLVHHGSGPPSTDLLDPGFATGLAAFAGAAAERYPWVQDWTPVNEPLTTARFSCLYGHWYPHWRDDLAFAHAVLNQCRGVVLAMRAIRAAVPEARLVQTEDMGKTHSTPTLAYQADLENERRWLSFDLLGGRVMPGHPMWGWLVDTAGVDAHDLEWFAENPCPPDVVGVNHYLSSERFLDERLERYPPDSHGGNGQDEYADILAARVLGPGPDGPRTILAEAWERYGLPVAVTEAHNGSTREEQLRWLSEVWDAAVSLRADGADVVAVTLWSLLGAVGWDDLVRGGGTYEPGVFDARSSPPRPTVLAEMARGLADGGYDHPVLATPGWWKRPERLWYEAVGDAAEPVASDGAPGLLITGARGTLGQAFARMCDLRGLPYVLLRRDEMDIANADSVERALELHEPWAIVNAAGYVRVDEAETDEARCRRENADGPATLGAAAERHGLQLLTFSSDLVFDGAQEEAYVELDLVHPLNRYGQTKAEGEVRAMFACSRALVVRTSAFFGPWDSHNFVTIALRELRAGRRFLAADDTVVSPTYVPDLVNGSLDLLIDGEAGVWHLANPGALTWFELAREAARRGGLDADKVISCTTRALRLAAARPAQSALGSIRGSVLPPLENALDRYKVAVAA